MKGGKGRGRDGQRIHYSALTEALRAIKWSLPSQMRKLRLREGVTGQASHNKSEA
jgi:hypothetical protein